MLGATEYRATLRRMEAEFDALDPDDEATWLSSELLPDPDHARLRVYATQSTHKTLTVAAPGLDDPRLRPGLRAEGAARPSTRPT